MDSGGLRVDSLGVGCSWLMVEGSGYRAGFPSWRDEA